MLKLNRNKQWSTQHDIKFVKAKQIVPLHSCENNAKTYRDISAALNGPQCFAI